MAERFKRWLLLVATVGLLAAACTDGSSESADSTDPDAPETAAGDEVVITMWDFGGGGQENVIQEWEDANPGVTVEFILSGFDEHHEKLLAGFVSGAVPDVAVIEVGYSSRFKAGPEHFVDLDAAYGAGSIQDRYLPFRWEHGVSPDGTIIGIPTDVGGLAVAYRADLFEEAGLPSDPDEVTALMTTWEDFLDLGERYVGATGNAFIDSSGILFESVVKQGPEGFYSQDGTPVYETSEHVAEAWAIATDAIERDLSANLAGFSPEWNTGMANGDYAVQLAPAWMLTYISTQAPDTEGAWSVARFPEGGGNWGGAQLTIPVDAEHPDLAWSLIEYVTAPEQEIKIFQEFGNFPSIPELYDDPAIVDFTRPFFRDAPVGEIYVESIETVEPQFEGRGQRVILRELGLGIGRVENGEETPDQAWESALRNIELELG